MQPAQRTRYCPRCRDLPLLEMTTADGLNLDSCSRCSGVWYDRGELTASFGVFRGQMPSAEAGPIDVELALRCPTCTPRILNERLLDPKDPTLMVAECTNCGGTWLDRDVWSRLYRRKRQLESPKKARPRGEDGLLFSRAHFDNVWVNVGGPLLALLIGGLIAFFDIGAPLFLPARIMIHEIGHAVPAWFSGRAALPLPFGLTFVNEDPSWFVSVCLLFLLGVFGYRSYTEGRKFGMVLTALLVALQVYFTFILSPFRSLMFVTFGGVAGEFVVSALLIMSFSHTLPDRLRWDFWRFFVILPAMVTLLSAIKLWVDISDKIATMPMGSMYGVPGDGQGDLEKLMDRFGWSADQITNICVMIGVASALVLVAHYGYVVANAIFFSDDD